MCGRYQLSTEYDILELREIMNELNRNALADTPKVKTGDIYPTENALTLVQNERKTHGGAWEALVYATPHVMKWGFPKWDGKGSIINVRAETAAQKPMFRRAFSQNRCVVPSTGFYEWSRASKEKYVLKIGEKPMLYMAAVFQKNDNESHFAIMTTAANTSVSPIHNRMPVLIYENELLAWLFDEQAAAKILARRQPELLVKTASGVEQTKMF